MSYNAEIKALEGKVIKEIIGVSKDSDEIRFFIEDGSCYLMYHEQDCCEAVYLEDFDGDVSDLVGAVVISAEEVSGEIPEEGTYYEDDSCTWTFYKIETNKGGLWLRWFGTSNGYYSESVDFVKVS